MWHRGGWWKVREGLRWQLVTNCTDFLTWTESYKVRTPTNQIYESVARKSSVPRVCEVEHVWNALGIEASRSGVGSTKVSEIWLHDILEKVAKYHLGYGKKKQEATRGSSRRHEINWGFKIISQLWENGQKELSMKQETLCQSAILFLISEHPYSQLIFLA